MGVDQNVVKQEVEDEVFRMASSRESRRSREEDVTLAQLSQTVRTFAPSTPQSLTKIKLKSSTRVSLSVFLSVTCLVAEKCRKRKEIIELWIFSPTFFGGRRNEKQNSS